MEGAHAVDSVPGRCQCGCAGCNHARRGMESGSLPGGTLCCTAGSVTHSTECTVVFYSHQLYSVLAKTTDVPDQQKCQRNHRPTFNVLEVDFFQILQFPGVKTRSCKRSWGSCCWHFLDRQGFPLKYFPAASNRIVFIDCVPLRQAFWFLLPTFPLGEFYFIYEKINRSKNRKA